MISLSASANCPTRATNRARPWRHFFASAYTRAGPTLLSIKPWRITCVQYFFDVLEFDSFPRQLSDLSWLGASWPFLCRIPRITFLWRHKFHRIKGLTKSPWPWPCPLLKVSKQMMRDKNMLLFKPFTFNRHTAAVWSIGVTLTIN